MKERIAEFIREKAYKPLSFAELAAAMGIAEKNQLQLRKALDEMESTGEVVRTRTERYGAPERMNLAVGRLQGHPKGFGFLVTDQPDTEDIFIGREALNGAWHGDRIVARLNPPTRAGGRVEGEVIRILQRAHTRVVGTFETGRHTGYVTPDDRRLTEDIIVPKGATNGAKSGEKVVVQIVTYPEGRRIAEGKVVERLGMKGAVGVDILSVIRKFGLPEEFPARVLKESETVPETVSPEAIAEEGRRDLRGWNIVTIDGEDAKDLDDAVNVERIGDGLWRLGVHIADVAYYVPEGSQLDREAYARATSVYLADRVVPMLPPRLSNGICSLNPAVDRLTLSCVMEINQEGKVLRYEIFPSVVRTIARMTYTKVNQILAGDAEARAEYQHLVPMFEEMLSLMEVLRIKRGRRGALDFDLPEAKVRLNESGWPIEIRRVERGVGERIIEEFMLVANETVAEHCFRQDAPFMYRVHGEPAADRLAGLRDFLQLFGYAFSMPRDGTVSPKLIQGITDWARGRPEENLINSILLRTMRQAVYMEQNLGHFGLAADFYCHFTSPIRRYPDLIVHRVLRTMLTGGISGKQRSKWERWMPEAGRHCSDRERVAMEAERETVDLKKAEFMSDKVGETFTGFISGVSTFGFFVQLPSTVEGLVHVSTLTDDYYHFHEKYYALIGERTRRRYRLGDPVVVRLARVDVDTRQIDFQVEVAESPVVTVVAVPSETRSRAAKKQALSAPARVEEAQPAPAEVAGPSGKKRKRRKAKPRGPLESAEAEVAAAPAPKPEPVREQVDRPSRQEAPRRFREEPRAERPVREVAREERSTARGRSLDMWGVPVPEGRVKSRMEEDPGVVNPFSITVPRNGRAPAKGAGGRAPVDPGGGVAPATADEAGTLAMPGTATRSGRSRRPRTRGRTRPRAGQTAGHE